MHYEPIPREGLQRLKEELAYTNGQMADLFGLATGRQFHKYLSTEYQRVMGFHVLMYGMLGVAFHRRIRVSSVEVLFEIAREYGATIDLSAPDGDSEQSQP